MRPNPGSYGSAWDLNAYTYMRLGPRPTHTTQGWVAWVGLGPSYKVLTLNDDRSRFNLDRSSFKDPGLGPTQLRNTPGAGSGPAPRLLLLKPQNYPRNPTFINQHPKSTFLSALNCPVSILKILKTP
ncbi:hypothetical protein PGT21_027223 [Puccinia graminis f. sp. tritici]|uniref:Uncharacterized protein n=1 Tax=Puccinia graminis f. sp. tritici TaxID=56615 RepID=A0A5B0NLM8_PUCGR|nr:hypothetical protein PGT21_027223 [Puccinia graminis f. sp. tritici]